MNRYDSLDDVNKLESATSLVLIPIECVFIHAHAPQIQQTLIKPTNSKRVFVFPLKQI